MSLSDIFVAINEGAIQFNLILGAHSAAKLFVSASTLDLHIEIEVWNGIPKFAAIALIVTIDAFWLNDL